MSIRISFRKSKGESEPELSDNCKRCMRDLEMAQLRMSACSACVQNCDSDNGQGPPRCRQQCTTNREEDSHYVTTKK